MKKTVLVLLITALLLPSVLIADPTEDQAVQNTASAVLNLFGLVLLTSLSAAAPAGVTVDLSVQGLNPAMKFEDFKVEPFESALSSLVNQIPFQSLSGTIDVSKEGDLKVDLKLSGGDIRNLKMASQGENLILLRADGIDYPHLLPYFGGVTPGSQSIPE